MGNFNQGGATLDGTLHWNGKRWSTAPAPNPGGTTAGTVNSLSSVSCASTSDCWAAGYTGSHNGQFADVLLHWNGKKWSSH